jgi:hypothetical protein
MGPPPFRDLLRSLEAEFGRLERENDGLVARGAELAAELERLRGSGGIGGGGGATVASTAGGDASTTLLSQWGSSGKSAAQAGGTDLENPSIDEMLLQVMPGPGASREPPADFIAPGMVDPKGYQLDNPMLSPSGVGNVLPSGAVADAAALAESSRTSSGYRKSASDPSPRGADFKRETSSKNCGPVGQFDLEASEDSAESNNGDDETKMVWTLQGFVKSVWFDCFFAGLILMNTLVMAAECQYQGFDVGHGMNLPGCNFPGCKLTRSAKSTWPGAEDAFRGLDVFFGCIFTFEVLIKLAVTKRDFVNSSWNWFDACIVCFWLVEKVVGAKLALDPMMLRLARLMKLLRVARMAKTIQAFDSLSVLIGSITASASVLLWSSVLLLMIQTMVALFLNSMLVDYMSNDANPREGRELLYGYFGTFTRSMMTMFELTLANWVPVSRALQDYVNEWYGLFMLSYKLAVGFAVVKVITGVFLHETFKVAASDDELMIVQKQRATQQHEQKMMRLFTQVDKSNDGLLSRQELKEALKDKRVKTWLSAMDIEVGDGDLLFDFLDNGDGQVTLLELIRGVARLKGNARSIDLVFMMRKLGEVANTLDEMQSERSSDGAGDQPKF